MIKVLRLRGNCVVYLDWANMHGWEKSLKRQINHEKVFRYLKKYSQVKEVKLYFGTDTNTKSKNFLKSASRAGYSVTTKPVKYIIAGIIDGQALKRRKCDFDMEICIDVHKDLTRGIGSFIFFTGDGDFEPLYKLLIEKRKQVIVVYSPGHLGREIWQMKKGIFKTEFENLMKL